MGSQHSSSVWSRTSWWLKPRVRQWQRSCFRENGQQKPDCSIVRLAFQRFNVQQGREAVELARKSIFGILWRIRSPNYDAKATRVRTISCAVVVGSHDDKVAIPVIPKQRASWSKLWKRRRGLIALAPCRIIDHPRAPFTYAKHHQRASDHELLAYGGCLAHKTDSPGVIHDSAALFGLEGHACCTESTHCHRECLRYPIRKSTSNREL